MQIMEIRHENIYVLNPEDICVPCDAPEYKSLPFVPPDLNREITAEIEVFNSPELDNEFRKLRITLDFMNEILELLQEAGKKDPSVLEKFNKLMDKYSDKS